MGLKQLILVGEKSIGNPEKDSISEFDLERNQKLQSCDVFSTLTFFPRITGVLHTWWLRLAAVIAGGWFIINAQIGETFKPFL